MMTDPSDPPAFTSNALRDYMEMAHRVRRPQSSIWQHAHEIAMVQGAQAIFSFTGLPQTLDERCFGSENFKTSILDAAIGLSVIPHDT